MKDQGKGLAKKRGRPATGHGMQVGVRCHQDLLGLVDNWRRKQPDIPTRSEAIRRLTTQALTKIGGGQSRI
jgi:hypothetical protein